jgi:two-component system nitrate/nitrite response regulator NarL
MASGTIKLAIIDEAPILSNGLLYMLQRYQNVEVVTTATTTSELLQNLRREPVDILLVDILRYYNGDQLVKKVKEKFPAIKVLVLSMNNHRKDAEYSVLRDPDVDGFLPARSDSRTLITAVEKIARGGGYFNEELLYLNHGETDNGKVQEVPRLTDRELEIIRLIEQEYTNRQIADRLLISERTVETHRKRIYQKTCTNNVIALIKYAYSHQLVD